MFQLAFGYSISKLFHTNLFLDKSFLERKDLGNNFTHRDYALNIFNYEPSFNYKINTLLLYKEPHFHFDEKLVLNVKTLLCQHKTIIFDGYWQTYKYFINSFDIQTLFTFKNPINQNAQTYRDRILTSNSIMVHIRRTDYINNPLHDCVPVSYLFDAINFMNHSVENPLYFVFSDDIEWCKKHLAFANVVFVENNTFDVDLQLMSLCKNFIISNSTFAWWSAFLAQHTQKIVVAPKRWFGDNNINTADLIPTSWIKL